MPAIETTALTKRFGDVTAVNTLDFVVEKGDAFGFLGPNGAGKSTTINLLLGFLKPTSGSASVLGHDVQTESKTIRQRIGVLPEGASVYERLTGREHVESAIRMKRADDDPDSLLDYVGLKPDAWNRPAGGYSTGMAQRLALAMALVGDPDLLILDEPSSGLDPTGIQEIREIIQDQLDDGRTVFFSSHILPEVEAVCERVAILTGGELATVGSVERLREMTAEDTWVELQVDALPDDLDLTTLEGVTDVEIDGSTVRVVCADPTVKVEVIRRVDESAQVLDVVSDEASLEAVFNTYAGSDRLDVLEGSR